MRSGTGRAIAIGMANDTAIRQTSDTWPTTNATTNADIQEAARALAAQVTFGDHYNAQPLIDQLAILADFIGMAYADHDVPDWGVDWNEAADVYADRIGRANVQTYARCVRINLRRALDTK
jgi:hypothetical protein